MAAKKARVSVGDTPPQIFAGRELFGWRLSGGQQILRPLVMKHGGTLTELHERRPRPHFANAPLVLVQEEDTLVALHAFMGGVSYRAVSRNWVTECVNAKPAKLVDASPFVKQILPATPAVEAQPQQAAAPLNTQEPEQNELSLVARALQLRYLAAPTHNAELAALFRELLRLETATYDTEEGRHNGTQGFARAAAVLRAAPAPITSLAALRRMELPFLGPDCVGFIAEFLREGELAGRIERLEGHRRDDKLCAKALFLKVPGVGLTFAGQWAEDGHRSLGDLQRAYAAETLRDQTKLGALGSAAVPCGDTLLSPIPLPEFTKLHDAVQQAAREVDTTLQCELTGGYSRRFVTPDCMVLEPHAAQADSSYHDVDVLVKYDDRNVMYAGGADWALTQLVRRLRKRLEVLVADMSGVDGSGEDAMCVEWDHICGKTPVGSANIDQFRKAFMIVKLPGKPPRRVDVVFVPASQYAFAILGWTGSRQFERWIRIYAKEQKPSLRLSNHCLFVDNRSANPPGKVCVLSRTGTHVPLHEPERMAKYIAGDAVDGFIETEKDIFAAIKLEWRPPHERCC